VSPVWLIPCTLAVLAAVVVVMATRSVRSEVAALSEQIRGLALIRDRARALQLESERTARVAELTLDALAPPPPQ
jgi:hypothetical protein